MALKDLLLSGFPEYCESLPSGREVCFRPMVVSEEKSLMLAKTSQDKSTILNTLQNVIMSCCSNTKKIDVKKLKLVDLEYLFLQLRAKSIGEIEGFTIVCPYTSEQVNLKINIIKDYKIFEQNVSNKIKITENVILVMNEPTAESLFKYPDYDKNEDSFYKFIGSCIKQIHTTTDIRECSDVSEKEMLEFIKTLTSSQFQKVLNYFDCIPRLEIIKKYTTSDNIERTLSLKGLFTYINFFFEHIDVPTFYRQIFQLKYYHNYGIQEIENMIPWEKTVHIEQIKEQLNEEKQIKKTEIGLINGIR